MRKCLLFIIILFTTAFIPLAAQDNSPWYFGTKIYDFKFEGLVNVEETQLRSVTSPYLGKVFTEQIYLDLYNSISSFGFFKDIKVRAESVDDKKEQLILVFMLKENPVVQKVQLTGNLNVTESDIYDQLATEEGEFFKKTLMRVDESAIKMLYRDKGFNDVKVTSRAEKLDANSVAVYYDIEEGLRKVVRKIMFIGNENIKSKELQKFLSTKKATLIEKGFYNADNIDLDKRALIALYKSKGYYDAEVRNHDVDFETNLKKNEISVTIKYYFFEGRVYKFGGYQISNNTVFNKEEIFDKFVLEKGDIFNFSKYNLDMSTLQGIYNNEGYIFNSYDIQLEIDKENAIAYPKIAIVERMRAHIEDIIIKGNEKTEEHVILRELPFEVGDVLSQSKIRQGLRNLEHTKFFELGKVNAGLENGSAPGLLKLVITVEETKAIDLKFGLSFSQDNPDADFPIKFIFGWTDRNFLGKGMGFGVNSEVSDSIQSVGLNYNVNYLGDERIYLGANFFYKHNSRSNVLQDLIAPTDTGVPDPYEGHYVFAEDQKEYLVEPDPKKGIEGVANPYKDYSAGDKFLGDPDSETINEYNLLTDYAYAVAMGETISDEYLMKYESHSLNLGLGTGYAWSVPELGIFSLKGNLAYSLTHISYDENLYRPYERFLRDYNNDFYFKNSLNVRFAWDMRDNPQNVNDGLYLVNNTTFTGGLMLGSTHYIKNKFAFEGYKKLFDVKVTDDWSYKTILAVHTSLDLFMPNFVFLNNDGDITVDKASSLADGHYQTTDQLYVDGMITRKGWSPKTGLEAVWQNWIELRWPLYQNYVNAELFFEATATWDSLKDMAKTESLYQNFYFTLGAGFRLTLPQLPIGIFLAKRFKVDANGNAIWQEGALNANEKNTNGGVDVVVSFNYSF